MQRNLLSFTIIYKFTSFIPAVGIITANLILLYPANLYLWFKLLIILLNLIGIAVVLYQLTFKSVNKIDLLLDIKHAIVWKEQQTHLYEIKSMRSIGYLMAIIHLSNNENNFRLPILPGTIPSNEFKTLLRTIKWQILKHS